MRRKDNINYLRLLEWEFVRNQRSSLDCVPLRQTDIQFKISDNVLHSTKQCVPLQPSTSPPNDSTFLGMNNYLCVVFVVPKVLATNKHDMLCSHMSSILLSIRCMLSQTVNWLSF